MRVLIADDSAIIRAILEQNLRKLYGSKIDVVASVSSGRRLCDAVRDKGCDIVLCDVDMPEMNGIEATKIINSDNKVPVILFSEHKEDKVNALKSGACDFIVKPDLKNYDSSFFSYLGEIIEKNIKSSSSLPVSSCIDTACNNTLPQKGQYKILCIGASTGGPTAVVSVLNGLGKDFPLPVLYSQHIEIGADVKMCKWLDESCPDIRVKLAKDKEVAVAGTVYMAPSDTHLVIDYVKSGGGPVIHLSKDPPERFLRPAVNKMFKSAAKFFGSTCLAVLLTGMGRDGADGCKEIIEKGGWTICEDRTTCAVFGMPAAAIEVGGARDVLPRDKIPDRILSLIKDL